MRELNVQEVENVNGGVFPAVYGAFVAYNYAVATYGGAAVAGFAVGAAASGAGAFVTFM